MEIISIILFLKIQSFTRFECFISKILIFSFKIMSAPFKIISKQIFFSPIKFIFNNILCFESFISERLLIAIEIIKFGTTTQIISRTFKFF